MSFIILHVNFSVFPTPLIEETIFFPLCVLGALVKKQLNEYILIYLLCLSSLFCFIRLCACFYAGTILFWLLQLCNVLYFEIRQYDASSFAFLFKHCFDYSGSFVVPYKFQDYLFSFSEKCHWYFDRDCTESRDCFEYCGHFNNINSSYT